MQTSVVNVTSGRKRFISYSPPRWMQSGNQRLPRRRLFQPRPGLRSSEQRHAQIPSDEELVSVAAQRQSASVNETGLRVENLAAVVFRAMPGQAAHDHQADYGCVFAVA